MSKNYINKESLSQLITNIKSSNPPGIFVSSVEPASAQPGDLWFVSNFNLPIIMTISPMLEMGSISSSTGLEETNEERMRTVDYIPIIEGQEYTFLNNSADNSGNRVIYYDKDKNPILNWNVDGENSYSYKHVSNGGTFETPTSIGACYMRVRISAVDANLTLTITGMFP